MSSSPDKEHVRRLSNEQVKTRLLTDKLVQGAKETLQVEMLDERYGRNDCEGACANDGCDEVE